VIFFKNKNKASSIGGPDNSPGDKDLRSNLPLPETPPSVSWQRNLVFVWMAQFLSIMGFSFGIPFVPYFFQEELGVKADDLAMWVALFGAATPLTLAIFSPVWGALADRMGRRPMLLRAYFGASIILTLMGTVTSPIWLIILRLGQGVLTGTVTASQALVSTHTPNHRSGLALGSLNSAVFSGALMGAFVGGWTAELFGYRIAFYFSGFVMLISASLVFFGVKEVFHRPPLPEKSGGIFAGIKPSVGQLKLALPILLLMTAVMFARQFDASFVPLLVQQIHGKIEGAALRTGMLFALCGLAGVFSGVSLGWLADRVSPGKIGKWSAFFAGLMMLPQAFVWSMGLLFPIRFLMIFAAGGLDPVLQIWLCKMTPAQSRGLIFGWSATARAVGWVFAPLAGGLVAGALGIRYIFLIGPFFYFTLIFLISITVKKIESNSGGKVPPDTPVPPEMITEKSA